MKARQRRKLKATGHLDLLRGIRVRGTPREERILRKLVKKGVKLVRDDGTRVLDVILSRLSTADSKDNKPLLAVNGGVPIYAEPMKAEKVGSGGNRTNPH